MFKRSFAFVILAPLLLALPGRCQRHEPPSDAYRAELLERGYTPLSAVNELRQVARFSRWLEAGGLGVSELSEMRVEEFLAWQRASGCTGPPTRS